MVFPAGSVASVEQANDLICEMGAAGLGEPPLPVRELLDELASVADSFSVVRPADDRGVVIATSRPEDGLLGYLLRLTMAHGLSVYDLELFRLYDPSECIDIDVQLPRDVTLPYLTRALLRDLVIRPTWPDPDSPFVIVTRADEVYVQTYRNNDGTYQLEYRAGGPDAHFAFQTSDVGFVVEVMWQWTIGDSEWRIEVPWARLEFDDEDVADSASSEPDPPGTRHESRYVSLQNEHRDDGSWLNLDAHLDPDGTLRIVGHDLGPVAESISSDGEYEYFYTIVARDVAALVIALGGHPETDILDLLAQRWSGGASYGLGGAIESSGVKYHFTNYF